MSHTPARAAASDAWTRHARQWSAVGQPLRPGPEDIAVTREAVAGWMAHAGRAPAVLVLGVTPELCALDADGIDRVVAVDKSRDMIGTTWPGRARARDEVVCGDWRRMPLAGASVDLVVGDGSLNALPDGASYTALGAELVRVLRPGGRWVVRCFVRPDERETTAQVWADLESGRIGSFHVLKWRLAMALHGETADGVAVADVWRTVHDAWPDLAALAARFGWADREVRTIEAYRDVATRYTFPTLGEVRHFLSGCGLTRLQVRTGTYELGERCPTLIADRARGGGQP